MASPKASLRHPSISQSHAQMGALPPWKAWLQLASPLLGRGVRGLAWVPSTGLDQGTEPGWGVGPEALRVFFNQSLWEMCPGPASMPTRLLLTPEVNTQMKPGADRQETPRGKNSQETPTVQSLPTSPRDGAELRREQLVPVRKAHRGLLQEERTRLKLSTVPSKPQVLEFDHPGTPNLRFHASVRP